MKEKAYFHLPGLFEFYELYRMFLPLFREHREYFYDWCEIGSVYGAPADCIWGGGRTGFGDAQPHRVLALMQEYGISGPAHLQQFAAPGRAPCRPEMQCPLCAV